MPSPCSAEIGIGAPRPRRKASLRPASAALLSHLLATSRIGVLVLRRRLAKCWSSGVTPARASISSSATSAWRIASSVCSRIRPSSDWSNTSSRPAVSTTVKSRSPRWPAPNRRSRVTPGWSSTSASFLPTRRLNRVDLPTFGRPTMAMVKAMERLFQRNQPRVVGQDKDRFIGDDRRQVRGIRQLLLAKDGAVIGRERDGEAARAGDQQPVADQHRPGPVDAVLLLLHVLERRQ